MNVAAILAAAMTLAPGVGLPSGENGGVPGMEPRPMSSSGAAGAGITAFSVSFSGKSFSCTMGDALLLLDKIFGTGMQIHGQGAVPFPLPGDPFAAPAAVEGCAVGYGAFFPGSAVRGSLSNGLTAEFHSAGDEYRFFASGTGGPNAGLVGFTFYSRAADGYTVSAAGSLMILGA